MRKIIVVSDSHGNFGALKKVAERESRWDLWIHLGDGLTEMEMLRRKWPDQSLAFGFEGVSGNNDPPGAYPELLALKIGAQRFLLTHGHLCGAGRGYEGLLAAARRERCRIVLFGHTHHYTDLQYRGTRLINPGSLCGYLTPQPGYLRIMAEAKRIEVERRMLSD